MSDKQSPNDPRSPSGSVPFRVLVDGRERVVENVDQLIILARDGVVREDTLVKLPGKDRWSPARTISALDGAFEIDPWAAWEDEEESEGEGSDAEHHSSDVPELPQDALLAEDPSEPVAELPADAVQIVPEGTRKDGRFVIESKPKAARRSASPSKVAPPRERPPSVSAPTRTPAAPSVPVRAPEPVRDNVIAFPSLASTATSGAHALAPMPEDPLFVLPTPASAPQAEPSTNTRWMRLVGIAAVAMLAVGMVNLWVRQVALETYQPRARTALAVATPGPEAETDPPVPEPVPEVVAPPVNELTLLDQELRGRMKTDVSPIQKPGDLESALYVELSRMELADVRIDARVTQWAGRKKDVPRSAEIQIRYTSKNGALDRELGAIGLIVGRYTQSYELDIARFEVLLDTGDDGVRRWPIDPAQARNYYIRRIDLPTFLLNMRREGGR